MRDKSCINISIHILTFNYLLIVNCFKTHKISLNTIFTKGDNSLLNPTEFVLMFFHETNFCLRLRSRKPYPTFSINAKVCIFELYLHKLNTHVIEK